MKTRNTLSFGLLVLMAMVGYGCDKGDAIGSCKTSKDCYNVYTYVCRNSTCELADDPGCRDGQKNNGESDVDCGGGCAACEEGKKCRIDSECTTGKCEDKICVRNECSSDKDCKSSSGIEMHGCSEEGVCMSCSDNVQNGDESAKDCGGSCDKCNNGLGCNENSDCKSGICGSNNTCEAPQTKCESNQDCANEEICEGGTCISCYDNIKNGDESDTDCGGIRCNQCALGKGCNSNSDCESKSCGSSGVCEEKTEPVTPEKPQTCSNGTKDGDETDTDCGGSCEQCTQDRYCKTDADCKSWKCVATSGSSDKVCAGNGCDSATEGAILINEVFTRPDESQKMQHSESNQMKFIELYNSTGSRVSLNNLTLIVTKGGAETNIKMQGCMDGKTYHVLYPSGKTLQSLDIDATMESVALDIIDTSEMYIRLVNNDNSVIIDNVKVEDTSSDTYNGISAGRGAVSTKQDIYEVFVPHNTIPIVTKPEGEDIKNLYSPGVANTSGFPLG